MKTIILLKGLQVLRLTWQYLKNAHDVWTTRLQRASEALADLRSATQILHP